GSRHHEFGFAAYQIFLLQGISGDDLASHVTFDWDGLTNSVLASARRRTSQPRTRDGGIILPLSEAGQQVGGAAGLLRPGQASSTRGLDTPDRIAAGALGRPLEVPERIGIKEILGLALGACEQHSFS